MNNSIWCILGGILVDPIIDMIQLAVSTVSYK